MSRLFPVVQPVTGKPSANEICPESIVCIQKGEAQGSEPHLAQGWKTFVFIRMDRPVPLAALLLLFSMGKTVTPQSRKKKVSEHTDKARRNAHSSHGEVSALAA
ncbi:hypothetical protein ATANTOWER_011722 [Ataeniobius toweri]|uniref:Uncharacterized protein n=1 Tax=Ataeniobius toweri TaxID=208326 RepID=A0ABU7C707_9TELE|nr:hypothetical protein [Ataeniobius toweri]